MLFTNRSCLEHELFLQVYIESNNHTSSPDGGDLDHWTVCSGYKYWGVCMALHYFQLTTGGYIYLYIWSRLLCRIIMLDACFLQVLCVHLYIIVNFIFGINSIQCLVNVYRQLTNGHDFTKKLSYDFLAMFVTVHFCPLLQGLFILIFHVLRNEVVSWFT